MTAVVTMLLITMGGGAQYVGEYPNMDSCRAAARATDGVSKSAKYMDIGYRLLCVPGADWEGSQ